MRLAEKGKRHIGISKGCVSPIDRTIERHGKKGMVLGTGEGGAGKEGPQAETFTKLKRKENPGKKVGVRRGGRNEGRIFLGRETITREGSGPATKKKTQPHNKKKNSQDLEGPRGRLLVLRSND